MKKLSVILLSLLVFTDCKTDTKTEKSAPVISIDGKDKADMQSEGSTLLKGEFIYFGEAAVLQTSNEIYAVVLDDKMKELNSMVKPYKTKPTDMVPVEVRGKITPKPESEEGWPFRLEIKEILNISKPNPENNKVIKLRETK